MKNTLVIDLDRCSGCDSCVAACKMENQMNLGVVRNHVSAIGPAGTFPDIEMYWLPMQCQQCENPGCIEVCPTGASYRDEETGIVLVNAEDCIGCESCLTGCPYGVRQLNPKTNTIEKCTLCFQRKNDENWVPACVHNCCCLLYTSKHAWLILKPAKCRETIPRSARRQPPRRRWMLPRSLLTICPTPPNSPSRRSSRS